MKAVTYSEYAPDDNYAKILKVQDIDDPKPKADEVVFEVKSAALNYNDIWGMRGQPVPVPLPHVSGSDAAGDVIALYLIYISEPTRPERISYAVFCLKNTMLTAQE